MATEKTPSVDAALDELPQHVEESVRSIVDFKVEHARAATTSQRTIERITAALGRPQFIAFIAAFVTVWVVVNVFAGALHLRQFDAPPFYWLQGLVSFTALCMTALILTTQRRLDRLAEERAQLTLQVAIVGEQKTTKLIQLLEEFRTDHPELPNRADPVAEAMSASANPQTVLEAIREGHEERLPDGLPPFA
ncbi:MAG: DUF1003 domain-containing protein [Vulcanimicrobiaceae bacterium]